MNETVNYIIRPLSKSEEQLLWEMCYNVLYVNQDSKSLKREIVEQPKLARYIHEWGRKDDRGFVAIESWNKQPLGAAWFRLFTGGDKGFGYIDDVTPELSIIVLPKYQSKGIGTKLMTVLLEEASIYYPVISLSVLSKNPALRLYQRLGFEDVYKTEDALTMKKVLSRKD